MTRELDDIIGLDEVVQKLPSKMVKRSHFDHRSTQDLVIVNGHHFANPKISLQNNYEKNIEH
jgi:hypothetical protein